MRNRTYKLTQRSFPDCSVPDDGSFPPANRTTVLEFYNLTAIPVINPVGLDKKGRDLLCSDPAEEPTSCLSARERNNFDDLLDELNRITGSEPTCPGDGNLDLRVDERDAEGVANFSTAVSPLFPFPVGGPSFFDLNLDAKTDQADADIVAANLGADCLDPCLRADLNGDGDVTVADLHLLKEARGPCELCGADLNGDGVVNRRDVRILRQQFGCGDDSSDDDSSDDDRSDHDG